MNTIDWGQAAVNNTNGFGKAATNNTIDFGEVCADSWSPETNLTGTGATPSFENEYSFQFDGVDDYINVGNPSDLNFSADDSFSFSVWFKKGSQSGYGGAFIKKQLTSGFFTGYQMYVVDDKVNFRIRQNSSNFHQIVDNNTHSINTWVHYVVTYDGSRTNGGLGLKMYKNGVLLTSVVKSGNFPSGSGQTTSIFGIGGDNVSGYISSTIDEVSVFNSELSASDITTIYNSGIPNNLNDLSTPPLSWWRMGEAATFDGIRDWDLVDQGTGGNDATSQNIAETERVTDVPT